MHAEAAELAHDVDDPLGVGPSKARLGRRDLDFGLMVVLADVIVIMRSSSASWVL